MISTHIQRKELKKGIDKYKAHREKVAKKLDTLKSEEAKERTQKYLDQLDSDIKKLEDRYDDLLGEDEKNSDDVEFSEAAFIS